VDEAAERDSAAVGDEVYLEVARLGVFPVAKRLVDVALAGVWDLALFESYRLSNRRYRIST